MGLMDKIKEVVGIEIEDEDDEEVVEEEKKEKVREARPSREAARSGQRRLNLSEKRLRSLVITRILLLERFAQTELMISA